MILPIELTKKPKVSFGDSLVNLPKYWTYFKNMAVAKYLPIQYEETDDTYELFAIDGSILYKCLIYKGSVPEAITSEYTQEQNDLDKTDWEENHKPIANSPVNPRDPETGATSVNVEPVPGFELRYETQGNTSLPKSSQSAATVYQISEESIFYQIVFQLDSDNIYMQVEIDGQNIFSGNDGIKFEDLEDLSLGTTGGGYYSQGSAGLEHPFGLYQYDSNKWLWKPPIPLHIDSDMKIKMKATNSSTSKDYLKGIAIRRSLV